jgi:hypothetical protein
MKRKRPNNKSPSPLAVNSKQRSARPNNTSLGLVSISPACLQFRAPSSPVAASPPLPSPPGWSPSPPVAPLPPFPADDASPTGVVAGPDGGGLRALLPLPRLPRLLHPGPPRISHPIHSLMCPCFFDSMPDRVLLTIPSLKQTFF